MISLPINHTPLTEPTYLVKGRSKIPDLITKLKHCGYPSCIENIDGYHTHYIVLDGWGSIKTYSDNHKALLTVSKDKIIAKLLNAGCVLKMDLGEGAKYSANIDTIGLLITDNDFIVYEGERLVYSYTDKIDLIDKCLESRKGATK